MDKMRLLRAFVTVMTITFIITCFTTLYQLSQLHATGYTRSKLDLLVEHGILTTNVSSLVNRTRIMLLWTPIFGNWNWYPSGLGNKPFQNDLCDFDDCFVTKDRSYLGVADAVLFHCRDDIGKWPATRQEHQLYGVACHESPSASDFRQYIDRINITMTYRRDSDVYFPNCWFSPLSNHSSNTPYTPTVILSERHQSIAWPVSNCNAMSGRELYANQLAQHIDLHIYGACGKYQCPRDQLEQCMQHFARNYKFYASFENSICKDYISEKFFLPLQYDIIPIVLGGGDYTIFPKHSYINVNDYKSPKHLADYLKYLAGNETAYNEYFQWKTKHEVVCLNKEKLFCDLCKMVHDGYQNRYADVNSWWANDICHNDAIRQHIQG